MLNNITQYFVFVFVFALSVIYFPTAVPPVHYTTGASIAQYGKLFAKSAVA